MNSFKDCCDNIGCPQGGSDNFGGFGSRPRRSFSFYRDQCQDVASSGFKNVCQPGGGLRGTVYVSLNGDMVGKFTGKIEGFSGLLGCMGNLGSIFGNTGANFPFAVQFGDRTI